MDVQPNITSRWNRADGEIITEVSRYLYQDLLIGTSDETVVEMRYDNGEFIPSTANVDAAIPFSTPDQNLS